jgi:pyridoxamine 5'-phosphate oxidase
MTTDPYALFGDWFAEAQAAEPNDPGAVALATVEPDADGLPRPDVRIVLMRGFDTNGFLVFTNYDSAKGRQIRQCPTAALCFHWKSIRRQVRVQGSIGRATVAESDAYFAGRPRPNQLSAWASRQSEPLDRRETFEARLAEMDARFPADVPRPGNWGGYRLVPDKIEFWEDRPGRQHWRTLFTRTADGWAEGLLFP